MKKKSINNNSSNKKTYKLSNLAYRKYIFKILTAARLPKYYYLFHFYF
jgi:hypothetical protein